VVGAGFAERTDPAALVIGPTGLGLSLNCKNVDDADDCSVRFGEDEPVLYVADSLKNRITVITDPMTRSTPDTQGRVLSSGGSLNDPLGLTVTPDGRILVVNGNDGYVTEITPRGAQVAKTLLDATGSPAGAGALFGILFDPQFGVVYVDDAANTLNLLH
jgi:DNA-binding beta-propeller fold protein YncE